jgi:hypothetical protein
VRSVNQLSLDHSQPPTPPGPATEDPREREPIQDPPVNPDYDDDGAEAVGQANDKTGRPVPQPAPDAIVSRS